MKVIQNGRILKLNNGKKRIIVGTHLYDSRTVFQGRLKDYEGFQHDTDPELDIMTVYNNWEDMTAIWHLGHPLNRRRVVASDFDITYMERPSDDLYTAFVPDRLAFEILPDSDIDEFEWKIKVKVIEALEEQIRFDTPDEPIFVIEDVEFEWEKDNANRQTD